MQPELSGSSAGQAQPEEEYDEEDEFQPLVPSKLVISAVSLRSSVDVASPYISADLAKICL